MLLSGNITLSTPPPSQRDVCPEPLKTYRCVSQDITIAPDGLSFTLQER